MQHAEIVLATLSATGRAAFKGLAFRLVLVDGAAQATEGAALQPPIRGARRGAMVGDPLQPLPARPPSSSPRWPRRWRWSGRCSSGFGRRAAWCSLEAGSTACAPPPSACGPSASSSARRRPFGGAARVRAAVQAPPPVRPRRWSAPVASADRGATVPHRMQYTLYTSPTAAGALCARRRTRRRSPPLAAAAARMLPPLTPHAPVHSPLPPPSQAASRGRRCAACQPSARRARRCACPPSWRPCSAAGRSRSRWPTRARRCTPGTAACARQGLPRACWRRARAGLGSLHDVVLAPPARETPAVGDGAVLPPPGPGRRQARGAAERAAGRAARHVVAPSQEHSSGEIRVLPTGVDPGEPGAQAVGHDHRAAPRRLASGAGASTPPPATTACCQSSPPCWSGAAAAGRCRPSRRWRPSPPCWRRRRAGPLPRRR